MRGQAPRTPLANERWLLGPVYWRYPDADLPTDHRNPTGTARLESADASVGRIAPLALIGFYLAFQPFAIWHGLLDTSDAAATYSTASGQRAGWYFLHYGTSVCLLGIATSMLGVLAWFTLRESPKWTVAAIALLVAGAANMTLGFGAEAVGFYYATDVALVEPAVATEYIQAWLDGGYYVLPVVLGLLAFTIGQAAAVRALYRVEILPLGLRRLLIAAVVLDVLKFFLPPLAAIPFEIAAAAIWVAFGFIALRSISSPDAKVGTAAS